MKTASRRLHSAFRILKSKIANPKSKMPSSRRRLLLESLENRSLMASVPWNEVTEIKTPAGTSGAGASGESRMVAMEGDTIVVSSRNDDQAAVDAGAASVYQRDDNGTPGDLGDDKWALAQTLFGSGTSPQSSDLATGDFFGDSVVINGEWMFVGASHPTTLCCPTPALGDGLGVAYAYRRVDGVWQYQQTLEPVGRGGINDEYARFWSIAIEGNLAAVSARSDDNANGVDAGAVHLYRFDGSSWVHNAKLISSEPGPNHFGVSVAVEGGEVIVGSILADGAVAQSGAVYVFSEVGGQWQETAKLFANDGQAQDAFGNQVAREGNTIAVGADEADPGGNRSGAVYVFELSDGVWTQTAKLRSSDLEADDHFGRQVELNNGTLIVGNWYGDGVIPDSGAVYAFERVAGQWTEVDKLFESDRTSGGIGTPSFGHMLNSGTSGEVAIVGGTGGGEVYVFAQDATRITTAYRNTTPQTITDRRGKTSGVTTSTINVTDVGTILDLDVRLDITHSNDNDLSVVLVSPSGTQIPLFAQVGGTGDNFTTTVLDSDASTSIGSGSAPFTGRFQPTGNLPSLTGTNLQGTWKVVITDSVAGSGGTLQGWSLRVKYQPQSKFYVVDDGSPDRTYEYRASGAAVENYAINSGNSAPRGTASTVAGDKVWVVDSNKNVYVYDTTGGLLGSWTAGSLDSNATVEGIATNGTDVWIVDAQQDQVFKYTGAASRTSGIQNAASSFSLNSGNADAKDLVTDGTSIWVVNDSTTDKVFKYNVSGKFLGSWTIMGAGSSPTGITLDPSSPSHLWIVDNGTDRVYQFDNAVGRTSGSQLPSTSFALAAGNTNPQGIADPPVASGGGGAAYDAALLQLLDEYLASARRKRR